MRYTYMNELKIEEEKYCGILKMWRKKFPKRFIFVLSNNHTSLFEHRLGNVMNKNFLKWDFGVNLQAAFLLGHV